MDDEWSTVTKEKRRLAPQTQLTKADFVVEPKSKVDAKKRGKTKRIINKSGGFHGPSRGWIEARHHSGHSRHHTGFEWDVLAAIM